MEPKRARDLQNGARGQKYGFFTLARIPADPINSLRRTVAPSYFRSVVMSLRVLTTGPKHDGTKGPRDQRAKGPKGQGTKGPGAKGQGPRAPSGPFGPVWEGTVGLNADGFFERFGALGSASDNEFTTQRSCRLRWQRIVPASFLKQVPARYAGGDCTRHRGDPWPDRRPKHPGER